MTPTLAVEHLQVGLDNMPDCGWHCGDSYRAAEQHAEEEHETFDDVRITLML